ncbi:MAG TPA: hypothetical protein VFQ61_03745 [Polyangiaceae bacterium]|nr:hypothetical protein [Polyangiaceae bacterium]
MSKKSGADAEGVLRQLAELHTVRTARLRDCDPDADGADAAFARLTDEEESRLVEAVVRRTRETPARRPLAGAVANPDQGLRRFGFERGRRYAGAWAAAATLILAGGAVYGTRAAPSWPEYVLASPPSDAQFRAAVDASVTAESDAVDHVYGIGRELRFVVRPRHPFAEAPSVRVYAGSNGTEALRAVRLEPLEGGSIRVSLKTGPGGYVPRPGPDQLLIVLGERSAWRSLVRRLSHPAGDVVQSFRVPVTWHRVNE